MSRRWQCRLFEFSPNTIRYQNNNLNSTWTKSISPIQNEKSIGEPYKYGRRSSEHFGSSTNSGKIDCWRIRQEIHGGRGFVTTKQFFFINFILIFLDSWWWILVRKENEKDYNRRKKSKRAYWVSRRCSGFWSFRSVFVVVRTPLQLPTWVLIEIFHFFSNFPTDKTRQRPQNSWESFTRRWRAHGRPRESIEGGPFHGWGGRQEIRWGAENRVDYLIVI